MSQVIAEEFDFIVVGGGSAGAAVAARLAEHRAFRVLLLEAGRRQNDLRFRLPVLTPFALAKKDAVWNFTTRPEPGLNGRRIAWPRGKGLGGSSLVNGMLWVRGDPAEYDHWAASGCAGWSYRDLLDVFKRSEAYAFGDPAQRGREGAVTIARHRPADPLSEAFLSACRNHQVPVRDDYNAGVSEGSGYLQFNQRRGLRHGTDRAYLEPARKLSNLIVREDAMASRILIENKRAIGVEYRAADGQRQAMARREVILCCGTVQSPKLLEVSGIGNGDVLRRSGISTLIHLPGVGENLRDHLNVRIGFRTSFRGTLNDVQHSVQWKARAMLRWLTRGGGPMSTIGATAHAFVKTRPELKRPDAKVQMLHFSAAHTTGNISGKLDGAPGFSISTFVLRPQSTGHCHVQSNDIDFPSEISANYLTHEDDIQSMIGGLRFVKNIISDDSFNELAIARDADLIELQSDQDLLEWARRTGLTSYHPIGTCKMGTDAMSVVDSRLRVIGVEGLRVADAAVMPTMPSSNTHAPTVMIGEKAAAMILEDLSNCNPC